MGAYHLDECSIFAARRILVLESVNVCTFLTVITGLYEIVLLPKPTLAI